MALNYERIKEAAQGYEAQMTKFLRDIVRAPGESSGEKAHADRIAHSTSTRWRSIRWGTCLATWGTARH